MYLPVSSFPRPYEPQLDHCFFKLDMMSATCSELFLIYFTRNRPSEQRIRGYIHTESTYIDTEK